jgi:hypothetical protein
MRFVDSVLTVSLEQVNEASIVEFQKEYKILSDFEDDAVGQWLKLAKARGDTQESDEVLVTLLVELHKKIDALTAIIKDDEREFLELEHSLKICGVGFDHIKLEESVLEEGQEYYVRVSMPVFPVRQMPLFVKAVSKSIAEIVTMHHKDQQDWNSYVTSRERIEIRQKRDSL